MPLILISLPDLIASTLRVARLDYAADDRRFPDFRTASFILRRYD